MNSVIQRGARPSLAARVARVAAVAAPLVVVACTREAPPPPPQSNATAAPAAEAAPASFRVRFETSAGNFVVEVTRSWAPRGADRFHQLVKEGFFTEARFFRVMQGFVAQFGMNGDPAVNSKWANANIPDDPVTQSNLRGRLTFASRAPTPNTRSSQLFFNLVNNSNLDQMGFAPIGEVVEGMDVVDQIYSGYGHVDAMQPGIAEGGNAYLQRNYPKLDYIRTATIIGG